MLFDLSALPICRVTHRGKVCLSPSHTRPGYPGCEWMFTRKKTPLLLLPSPTALFLCCGACPKVHLFSAVSAETTKAAERRPEAIQKEDQHTQPRPGRCLRLVCVSKGSLSATSLGVSVGLAQSSHSSHTRGSAQPQLSKGRTQ